MWFSWTFETLFVLCLLRYCYGFLFAQRCFIYDAITLLQPKQKKQLKKQINKWFDYTDTQFVFFTYECGMGTCTFFICFSHCTGIVSFALCFPFFSVWWYGSVSLASIQFHTDLFRVSVELFGLSTALISSFMSFELLLLLFCCLILFLPTHCSHAIFCTHPFISSSSCVW